MAGGPSAAGGRPGTPGGPRGGARTPADAASLLVVEDDENLRLALADNLEDEGYAVRAVATLADAAAAVRASAPALVVLDVMLPDGDGIRFCRTLRGEGYAGRVLVLTARSQESDLVRGLDAGADDYLAKPYRLAELLARIRALLRRGPAPGAGADSPAAAPAAPAAGARTERLRFAGHTLDLAARELRDAAGRVVELTRTEMDLLACLLRHPRRALSRDEILDLVWGAEVVVDARTVDNFVASLKRKLGPQFAVATVRGVGYRLEVPVAVEPADASAPRPTATPSAAGSPPE